MQQVDKRFIRSGWKGWLLLYASWTIPPVVISSGLFLSGTEAGSGESWFDIFISQLWFYYFFASICPAMYRIGFRLKFSGRLLLKSVPELVLLCIATLLLMHTVSAVASLLFDSNVHSFGDALRDKFAGPATVNTSFIGVFYYLAVVSVTTIIKLHRQRQWQESATQQLRIRSSKLESQLWQARLQVLKAQLRPHFLFNALNSISALIETKQNDAAYDAVAKLGGLLRTTLEFQDTSLISLKQELAFVTDYLKIEQLRKGHRLKTQMDIPEECLQSMVPSLMLQPLVENCIHHGLTDTDSCMTITIRARSNKNNLCLEIIDDGVGLSVDWSLSENAGNGLRHVCSQLKETYGHNGTMKLSVNAEGGVTVNLILPSSSGHDKPDTPGAGIAND